MYYDILKKNNINYEIIFENCLNKIDNVHLYNDPFPHIIIENFIDNNLFQQLRTNFPDNNFIFEKHSDSLYKKTFTRSMIKINNKNNLDKLHTSYKKIYSFFSSKKYINQVSKIFQKKIPKSITEMQIIKDKNNYRITPHCDTYLERNKYLTSLLYLPDDNISTDLGTELYISDKNGKIDGTHGYYDRTDPQNYPKKFTLVKKIEYKPNTLLIFIPEYQVTWHGVSRININKNNIRKTLQIFQKPIK
jgi:hypothetical protein